MKTIKFLTLTILAISLTVMSFAQTADELINKHIEAIGGKENWKKVNSMRSEATLSTQGIDIPVVITQVHNIGMKQEFTVMGMSGYSIIGVDGGWNFNPMQGQQKPEPITQDELNIGKEQLDLQGEFLDYKEKGHNVELLGNEDVDGTSCYKLKLTRKSGREATYLLDPKTFYIIRAISKMTANGQEMPAPINMNKIEVNLAVDQSIFKVQQ
jgi:hypothetical protein